jgi:hypothetical protein
MTRISETVAANRDRFLGELEEFLTFASVSGNGPALHSAADWVAHYR